MIWVCPGERGKVVQGGTSHKATFFRNLDELYPDCTLNTSTARVA